MTKQEYNAALERIAVLMDLSEVAEEVSPEELAELEDLVDKVEKYEEEYHPMK